ncbi:hypothetical protein GNI_172920 [Gregarina niphandrodes]|uniref:Uncharacterized protein n=1 Tax=Gregarina niphandrodes TaxID=110365 RepID=A0A023AXN1_GRENI|nr:hypothetical protein GNI_172920 [Gregarina niphandrodes]EZG43407.1 hypothetical protein GNI_172920 [Gregarina niphandrodes]|eukprot:XP_011133348.1 hypothetical protein GNI_172920 [Gregarina niphandrodes]
MKERQAALDSLRNKRVVVPPHIKQRFYDDRTVTEVISETVVDEPMFPPPQDLQPYNSHSPSKTKSRRAKKNEEEKEAFAEFMRQHSDISDYYQYAKQWIPNEGGKKPLDVPPRTSILDYRDSMASFPMGSTLPSSIPMTSFPGSVFSNSPLPSQGMEEIANEMRQAAREYRSHSPDITTRADNLAVDTLDAARNSVGQSGWMAQRSSSLVNGVGPFPPPGSGIPPEPAPRLYAPATSLPFQLPQTVPSSAPFPNSAPFRAEQELKAPFPPVNENRRYPEKSLIHTIPDGPWRTTATGTDIVYDTIDQRNMRTTETQGSRTLY